MTPFEVRLQRYEEIRKPHYTIYGFSYHNYGIDILTRGR